MDQLPPFKSVAVSTTFELIYIKLTSCYIK